MKRESIGVALLAPVCIVAACGGSGMSLSKAEREEYLRAWAEDGRQDGARVRDSIPICEDAEIPEGARRLEGTLMHPGSTQACIDSSCRGAMMCCDACELAPEVVPRSGFKPAARIVIEGKMKKLFRGKYRADCESRAWWVGMGAPLVRLTWIPDPKAPKDARQVIELCRVEPAR